MKADDLRPMLKTYARALDAAGARPCADTLKLLVKSLDANGIPNLRELSQRGQGSLPEHGRELFTRLANTLTDLRDVLASAGNQTVLLQLQLLLDAIGEQSQRARRNSVEAVASASTQRRKKGTASVDRQLVDRYLERLRAALGDDAAFETLFRELMTDVRVTKTEAVAIADGFIGGVAPGASRTKALQRVRYRHDKLKDFESASKLITRGKTAA